MAKTDRVSIHDLVMPENSKKETSTASKNTFDQLDLALCQALHEAINDSAQDTHDGIFHQLISYVESKLITEALRINNNNQVLAAKQLGLHRTTLRKKIPKSEA